MILHFGVIDLPYNLPRGPRSKARAGTVTTGDVAGWLEDRYHVFEVFFRENETQVGDRLAESLRGAAENLMLGAPAAFNPFGGATSQIEDDLKQWIITGQMDKLGYPGVPTQAAVLRAQGKRRSSRMKRRRSTGAGPVSFVDTGLYQSSIKAWTGSG